MNLQPRNLEVRLSITNMSHNSIAKINFPRGMKKNVVTLPGNILHFKGRMYLNISLIRIIITFRNNRRALKMHTVDAYKCTFNRRSNYSCSAKMRIRRPADSTTIIVQGLGSRLKSKCKSRPTILDMERYAQANAYSRLEQPVHGDKPFVSASTIDSVDHPLPSPPFSTYGPSIVTVYNPFLPQGNLTRRRERRKEKWENL
jgi:hypothetical protein